MNDREVQITFRVNVDGTFSVEEFGLHHSNATLGVAIGFIVDRLRSMQVEVSTPNELAP